MFFQEHLFLLFCLAGAIFLAWYFSKKSGEKKPEMVPVDPVGSEELVSPPYNWKKIAEANNNPEADIIKGYLEENGIPVFLRGYTHRSMLGFFGPYVRLDILVPAGREDEAKRLLDEAR